MVGTNGSALPIHEHEQHQSLNERHSLKADRENDPMPHSQDLF